MIVQMNEKPQKCTCMSNIFIYLSKPERLSHLDTSMKCASSHWLATLQHILCLHSTFDGNSASLQHQLTSLNRFYMMFLALIQLRYRYTMAHLLPSKLAAFLIISPLHDFNYHQLPPLVCSCTRFTSFYMQWLCLLYC